MSGHSPPRMLFALAFAVAPACGFATGPYPSVGICQLLGNMLAYEGKSIELHSEVMFTEHGRHLFGHQCSGDLALSIDDDQFNNKDTIAFIRKIFGQGGRGSVTIIGKPVMESLRTFKGRFILQDVVAVGPAN